MTTATTTGWWRRNALALGALVLLVPASYVAFDTIEFAPLRTPVFAVAADETATVNEWQFEDVRLRRVDPASVGAPSGSAPAVVSVRVQPGTAAVLCFQPTVLDANDGREWRNAGELAWTPGDHQQTYCPSSEVATDYDLAAIVLLPAAFADDAGRLDDLVVSVSLQSGDAPLDLRLPVGRVIAND